MLTTRRKNGFRHVRFATMLLTVIAVVAVAMMLSSNYASAAGIKIIRGYVKDSAGHLLSGTNVVLEVRTPSNTLRFTDSYTTNSTGFYSFTLSSFANEFQDGDTFKVIANYNSNQKNVSQVDDLQPIQYINITYPFEIPQFGGLLGFGIAAGAVGMVAMVFIVMRKKKK